MALTELQIAQGKPPKKQQYKLFGDVLGTAGIHQFDTPKR